MAPFSTSARLPRSGNAALTTAALIQALVGTEFLLAGLSKAADPSYAQQFHSFVQGSPGAASGPFAGVIRLLVLPNLDAVAQGDLDRDVAVGRIADVDEIGLERFGRDVEIVGDDQRSRGEPRLEEFEHPQIERSKSRRWCRKPPNASAARARFEGGQRGEGP